MIWVNGKTDFYIARLMDEMCIIGDRVSSLYTEIQGVKDHSVKLGEIVTGLLDKQAAGNGVAHQTIRDTISKLTADTSVKFAALNAKLQELTDAVNKNQTALGASSNDSGDGCRGDRDCNCDGLSRDPYRHREGTYDTGVTAASQSALSVKIRREDIGMFDLFFDDPDDMGMVFDGKNVIRYNETSLALKQIAKDDQGLE
ncbi:uncharacterized protein B0T15DRAFT_509855 [Chaetomium strumarium]|uniref:Uncharacterized protein n=1 Tax=Chaetomium strumarium TaxID=1170767 RepID=A0AAJ0M2D9_9PEZI|nr:hypothetical protein B0T15DRAFT_509855 [Chaetomium strumarium]